MIHPGLRVLVLNSGSSSIKFELFRMPEEEVESSGLLERIGEPESRLKCRLDDKDELIERRVHDHSEGLGIILDLLSGPASTGSRPIDAIGHRVVHGGEGFAEPAIVTKEVEEAIEDNFALAPLHNPPNLMGIRAARERLPGVLQVAVFDTAFHQTMPPHAYRYALPEELYLEHQVRRYGFHGTSHRYVAKRAAEMLRRPLEDISIVSCHLGNGCSMAAIKGGLSIDTSMGLTPLEGLVMGTRSGDVDPSLPAFLSRTAQMSPKEVDVLLNKKSGLLGLSGGLSNDMRVLLESEAAGDEKARLAIDTYCHRIRKYLGAYAAVLGRLDALVFTAGVGERSPAIRARVLEELSILGLHLNDARNQRVVGIEADIASEDSPVRILVVPTNEELMIARDTYELVLARGPSAA